MKDYTNLLPAMPCCQRVNSLNPQGCFDTAMHGVITQFILLQMLKLLLLLRFLNLRF